MAAVAAPALVKGGWKTGCAVDPLLDADVVPACVGFMLLQMAAVRGACGDDLHGVHAVAVREDLRPLTAAHGAYAEERHCLHVGEVREGGGVEDGG